MKRSYRFFWVAITQLHIEEDNALGIIVNYFLAMQLCEEDDDDMLGASSFFLFL